LFAASSPPSQKTSALCVIISDRSDIDRAYLKSCTSKSPVPAPARLSASREPSYSLELSRMVRPSDILCIYD
jgi:hypothetical protein